MKREERNEYNYIRRTIRDHQKHGMQMTYGTTLTIRTDAGTEYKRALHDFYMSLGFHPASVRVDRRFFDEKERLIYIYGQSWEMNGEEHPWTELFTAEEKQRFEQALA